MGRGWRLVDQLREHFGRMGASAKEVMATYGSVTLRSRPMSRPDAITSEKIFWFRILCGCWGTRRKTSLLSPGLGVMVDT